MLKSGAACILIEARQDLGTAVTVTDFSTLSLCLVIIVSLKILVKFDSGYDL